VTAPHPDLSFLESFRPQASHSSRLARRKPLIHVGSLIGTGKLYSGNEELGKTDYSIHVWLDEEAKLKRADGKIEADERVLNRAMGAGSVQLRLQSGSEVVIALKARRLMVGRADVAVTGAVPGF
jgi:hypothetical protein